MNVIFQNEASDEKTQTACVVLVRNSTEQGIVGFIIDIIKTLRFHIPT